MDWQLSIPCASHLGMKLGHLVAVAEVSVESGITLALQTCTSRISGPEVVVSSSLVALGST